LLAACFILTQDPRGVGFVTRTQVFLFEIKHSNEQAGIFSSFTSLTFARLFLKGEDGQRPVLKYHPKLATDPHFKHYILFHEYFQRDNGRGVSASHQTGCTGLIAKLLQPSSIAKSNSRVPASRASEPFAKASQESVVS
jgi:hypothetical protein